MPSNFTLEQSGSDFIWKNIPEAFLQDLSGSAEFDKYSTKNSAYIIFPEPVDNSNEIVNTATSTEEAIPISQTSEDSTSSGENSDSQTPGGNSDVQPSENDQPQEQDKPVDDTQASDSGQTQEQDTPEENTQLNENNDTNIVPDSNSTQENTDSQPPAENNDPSPVESAPTPTSKLDRYRSLMDVFLRSLNLYEANAQESETEEPSSVPEKLKQSIIFSDFSMPGEYGDTDIGTTYVKFSINGLSGIPSDQIVFEYWSDDSWKIMGTIPVCELANKTDYLSFALTEFDSWNDIANLKIKVSYQADQIARSPDQELKIFLDSIWLETEYNKNDDGQEQTNDEELEDGKEYEVKSFLEKYEFAAKEDLKLRFQYKRKQRSLFAKIGSGIKSLFFDEYKNLKINATASMTGQSSNELPLEIEYLKNGEFIVREPEKDRQFKPGKYILKLTIEDGENTITEEKEFTWGVLAINTSKSIYRTGEKADLYIGVLDDKGHTICNAQLLMAITGPDGITQEFNTETGDISKNDSCGPDNVTDSPDYSAAYQTGMVGLYMVRLTAMTENGIEEITDSFEVRDYVPFEIERIGATRIYPKSSYGLDFKVKANIDYQGEFKEIVPDSFEIINSEGASVVPATGTKEIVWQVDWKAGGTYYLRYTYKAPDISPEFYLLGPAKMDNFEELRSWQIASDATAGVVLAEAITVSAGNTDTANWTTVVTASSTDFTAGDKYLVYVNVGFSSNNTAGTIDYQVLYGSDVMLDGLVEPNGSANDAFQISWFDVYDQPSTATDIIVQFRPNSNTARALNAQILAINLSDLSADDWKYGTNTTQVAHGTAMAARSTITLDKANGLKDWLVMGMEEVIIDNDTVRYEGEIFDGSNAYMGQSVEGENTNEVRSYVLYRGFDNVATNTQFSLRSRDSGAAAQNDHYQSRIFALNLDAFDSHKLRYADINVNMAANGNWYEMGNLNSGGNYSPAITGDQLIFASYIDDIRNNSAGTDNRLQVNGSTVPSGWSWTQSPVVSITPFDVNDERADNIFAMTSIPSAGYAIDLDAYRVGQAQVGDEVSITAFSQEKYNYLTISADNQYASDGTTAIPNDSWTSSSTVYLKSSSVSRVGSNSVYFYFQFIATSSSFSTATTEPASYCSSGTAFNSCFSKIWRVSASTTASNASSTLRIPSLPETNFYKWQVKAFDNAGYSSDWRVFNTVVPNIKVDIASPTPPGDLTEGLSTGNSITLNFGATSSDTYFDRYRVFYKTGTSGVTESDSEQSDANLNYIDYNDQSSTVVGGLSPNTDYVFNIWAYDISGKKASATEISIKTQNAMSVNAYRQYKSDNTTNIANLGWTNESQINLSALANTTSSSTKRLDYYFQLYDDTGTFTTATSVPGSSCTSGTAFGSCASNIWKASASTTEWYDSNWKYRKKITVNHVKVMETIDDYVLLATTTDLDMAYTSFGGHMASSSGADLVVTDSTGTTTLYYEREYYASSTGDMVLWVRADISSTTDTTLYLYYGNTANTIDQASPEDVWETQYKIVHHMEESPTGTVYDSTQYNNDGTTAGAMTASDLISGYIGQAVDFDGVNDNMAIPDNANGSTDALTGAGQARTWSFWVNFPSFVHNTWGTILSDKTNAFDGTDVWTEVHDSPNILRGGVAGGDDVTSPALNTNQWYHFVNTYTGTIMKLYMNGQLVSTKAQTAGADDNNPIRIMGGNTDYRTRGILDELRYLNTSLSTTTIQTEYNNQSDVDSFLDFGTEESFTLMTYEAAVNITGIPERGSATTTDGYKWQVLVCSDAGSCSAWDSFNNTLPNFRVDTTDPTAPGDLSLSTSTPITLLLNYGASTTEINFDTYKIFYKSGISGVAETDYQHYDTNLGFIDYNSAVDTLVSNLEAATQYVINIWAYDFAGNKNSATELVQTTPSAPHARGNSVMFLAGNYSGNGTTGQNTNATNTFNSFAFKLVEDEAEIRSAYVLFEAQYEAYHSDSDNYTGLDMSFDSCLDPCTAEAFGASSTIKEDTNILSYNEDSGNQIRALLDVTDEAQLNEYTGEWMTMNGQFGYRLKTDTATNSIANAKAVLVLTYAYNSDESDYYTNTVLYPLESSASGDSGTRRASSSDNCTKNSTCPKFDYKFTVPEIDSSLSQWYQIYGQNDGHGSNDVMVNVNVQGTDLDSNTYMHEAANGNEQANFPMMIFNGVSGFSENPTATQTLEVYAGSSGATYYLQGGEVVDTYYAPKTAATKTRTVSYPIGVLTNGQDINTASASVTVYFPENGQGTGQVTIKKAWFRIIGSDYYDQAHTVIVASQVGANTKSANYIYNLNPAAGNIKPSFNIIHVIPPADYAELAGANSATGKSVSLNTTNSSTYLGGVSAELMITYAYTSESNGYLSSMNLFGGQSDAAGNSQSLVASTAKIVLPEVRGAKTLRAAGLLSSFLINDSDENVVGDWFTFDSNISAGTPSCSPSFGYRPDDTNSFGEYYKNVLSSFGAVVDKQAFNACYANFNSNASNANAGAKMNGIWLYTYQWTAPPSELTQDKWRWYENIDAVQPTTAMADEKTAISGVNIGEALRMRMNIYVSKQEMSTSSQAFKLQYAQASDCTAVSSSTWQDVGGLTDSTAWTGYNNLSPLDGANITSLLLSSSSVMQTYEETNSSLANPNAVAIGQWAEWDWAIYNNSATSSSDYCFRMINNDGTELSDYLSDSYPKLLTAKANTEPDAPNNLNQYRSNGTTTIANLGWTNERYTSTTTLVSFTSAATDPNLNEAISLYYELIPSTNSFTTATSEPASPCATSTVYENCASKIWYATSTVGDYRTDPFRATSTIRGIPNASAGYKWQVMACDDGGECSAWSQFGASPNFRVDTIDPTAPGILSFTNVQALALDLQFGASTTETNFYRYRIFYKTGASNVSESDIEHTDSDLNFQNYNTTATTSVINLSAGTLYYFNIWAYDYAGNKSSSTVVSSTTVSSFSKPTGSLLSASQKTDGSGSVDLVINADDPDNDNTLSAKIEYVQGATCNFAVPLDPTIDTTDANTTANLGDDPKVDNIYAYQVGTSSGYIWTSLGANTVYFDWLSAADLPNIEDTYCVRLTLNDNTISGDQATPTTQTLFIDNKAPTEPGVLTLGSKHYNSITLRYGTSSTDMNFDQYKIFYKIGTAGATESDSSWTKANDINLDAYNFNGATSTTITGLTPSTNYVFKIWAYDAYGNKSSSTEFTTKTNSKPINISATGQYKSDYSTAVANGAWTEENSITMKASVHDQDAGDLVSFYYQMIPIAQSYITASTTPPSNPCLSGTAYGSCASRVWYISTTTSVLPSDWYDQSWLYRKKITINSSQVVSVESGFPVLATTTDSNLASKARADGYDILFTSSNGTTTVPYEREYYNSSTGQLAAWIKTDVSSTTNTELYMYYGNSGASTDYSTTTGVWDSSYRGVWHLAEDVVDEANTLNTHIDSTLNGNFGDQYGNNEITGRIFRGQDFDGTDDYINIDDAASLDITNALTMDFWFNGVAPSLADQKISYTAAGTETFYVPEGVTSITVKMWGGGAGGGGGSNGGTSQTRSAGGDGGGGGYSQATIAVVPGEALTIITGGGGTGGGYIADGAGGGGGGGRSEISRSGTALVVAAGGGGGGGADNRNYSAGAPGGAGGALTGTDGTNSGTANPGTGGSQSAGGSGGTGTNAGADGSSSTGGAGADGRNGEGADGSGSAGGTGGGGNGGLGSIRNNYPGAGGGGGGYYGGGGGGEGSADGTAGAGGGGGSSYVSGTATSTTGGSGATPGNTSDADYASSVGVGGAGGPWGNAGSSGNAGKVVITYKPAVVLAGKGNAYQIDLNNSSVLSGMIGSTTVQKTMTSGWHHAALSYDSGAGGTDEMKLYIDGNIEATADYSTAITTNSSALKIGEKFDGVIDELRVSATARSSGWIKTSYRNQTSVASFMSFDSEATVSSYYEYGLVTGIPDSATGYKWQAMACDDDGDCSGWAQYNATTPNFKVDITDPTAPGALTENSKTSNSITLNFGSQTSETNFSRYRIYYSSSTPATESSVEHADSNLLYINYNGASVTTVSGLENDTNYYFNIWAYDAAGHKTSSTETMISTSGASSTPGVIFYSRGSRILYYRVWDGTAWGPQKTGPTFGSAAGDNIKHIRSVRSDDGGKVGVVVKTWDGTNQEYWAGVYRFAADDFIGTSSLGSAQASGNYRDVMTTCIAPLSSGEFMVIRNNNDSSGSLAYSWNQGDGWTAEGNGPNSGAILTGCNLVRRPSTDNYLLAIHDSDGDIGASYYYGGSAYINTSWTAWTEHSSSENEATNTMATAFFDAGNNTKGAIAFTNNAASTYTQAKYFSVSNNSISYGSASSSPTTWTGSFVHGEFASDPAGSGIAYFAGRDTNDELNVYQVSVNSGTQPAWTQAANGDDMSSASLYAETNYSNKPFALTFFKNGLGVVSWSYNLGITAPEYSVITTAGNTMDASPTAVPGAGNNWWTRIRFYNDPNENQFIGIYQNDDIDYAAIFWDGKNNEFFSAGAQAYTELATTTGALDKDDESAVFAFAKYNTAPYAPTTLGQYKSDASTTIANNSWTNENEIVLKASARDADTAENIRIYYQFLANGETFATSTDEPTSPCASSTTFAACTSKIWVATSSISDYSYTAFAGSVRLASVPESAVGYKWQSMACDDSGACSSWASFNATIPNVKIDITPPTAPGEMSIYSKTSYSITLAFGTPSTETNFYQYKIYYSTSSPVTMNNTQHTDSDLNSRTFNGTTNTIVTGLASTTTYYFNIWAFDLAGNVATSVAEISTTTSAASALRQMSYRLENDDGPDVNNNTAAAAIDTSLSGLYKGERIIARIQIDNNGGDTAMNKVYKLQYENQTDLPGVWFDVGSATQTTYALGLSGANGNSITSSKTSMNAKTWANGTWHENTLNTGSYSLTNGYYTEFAFAIHTGNAIAGKTYRLRLYNNTDNLPLDTYSVYPTFSLAAATNAVYSKNSVASLSTATSSLSYYLDPLGYSNLSADDSAREAATSSSNIPVYQFVMSTTTNTYSMTATWNGQSSVAASTRNIFLQIYRFGTTNAWVTVATNTTSVADTDFNLSATINSNLSQYYDTSNRSYWRVYQTSGTQVLRTDNFSLSYSTPIPEVKQYHYRWRNDNGSETTATWREAWDIPDPTTGSNLLIGSSTRLRFAVANTGAGSATNYIYNLQYAPTLTGCASDPGGWVTVPVSQTTEHFDIAVSSYFANQDNTTATSSNTEGYTYVSGRMVEDPSATTSAITMAEARYTEIEYIFRPNSNATLGGTYCFRVTNSGSALNTYSIYPEITLAGNTNIAPSFNVAPSDGGSSTTTPTNYGQQVNFSATGVDTDGDDYYLAVCQTNSITAGNNAPPTCNGGNWCISSAASTTVAASCSYTTATTSESLDWYAFVCDKKAGASVAKCSASSQGTIGSANGSPFNVNHAPTYTAITTTLNNRNPGENFLITASSSDSDTTGAADTLYLYVCKTNAATFAGCNGGVTDTVCSAIASSSPNPACGFSTSIPALAATTTYYAFVYDSHGMAAAANSRSNTYTVNNVATNLGTLVLNGNAAITLNLRGASDKTVQTTIDVSDDNGCENASLVSATAVIYMSGVANGYNCTADYNNCYQINAANCVKSNCSGSTDTTASYTCTSYMRYHAIPTDTAANNPYEAYDWLSRIVVNDGANLTATASAGVELNTSQALEINESLIDFGSSLNPGQNSGTTNQPSTVSNSGNCPINTDVSGTDLDGNPTGTITVDYLKYSLSSGFNYLTQGTNLSTSAFNLDIDVGRATSTTVKSDIIYWGIGIPFGADRVTYYGENYFSSSLDSANWN